MKTHIKAPEKARITKIPTRTLQDGDLPNAFNEIRDAICNGVGSVGEQIGCKNESRSNFVDSICSFLNSLLSSVGCDPIQSDLPVECFLDEDCDDMMICSLNACISDPMDCRNDDDLCDPWQSCSVDSGECEDEEGHCHFVECEDFEDCDDDTGNCQLMEGKCVSGNDCSEPTPICKEEEHDCVACLDWSDCGDGFECENSTCAPCPGIGSSCESSGDCCSHLFCELGLNECQM